MGNACACCGRFEVSIKKQLASAEILYNAYTQVSSRRHMVRAIQC